LNAAVAAQALFAIVIVLAVVCSVEGKKGRLGKVPRHQLVSEIVEVVL